MAQPTGTVHLVPHTHWDREWYEPFQRFRLRLVDLLDDVLARAEADPTFHFTLDGQLAAVDDYLEIRPEAAGLVARLVRRGQLAIGPWAILMDEFLCSGENMVRNLEWGLHRAEQLGGAMEVGYLPDMFGHIAQMPQLLARAGLPLACVFRGVPAAVDRHAFAWVAPDGTAVRTEYLPGGYGNAAAIFADLTRLGDAARDHRGRMRPWYGDDPVLAMYGTDHAAPLPGLTEAVAALGGPVRLKLTTLGAYLALFDPADLDGLPVWHGELRSHARANILPGVLSNRPHLKQGLSHAERMVERYAEPLAALWGVDCGQPWPQRLLDLAWQRLVQSSCHDSVTGCGVDETAVQVAARIAEAEQIGRGVRDRVLTGLAARTPEDAVVVVNPSPYPRTAVVRATVTAPHDWAELALELPGGGLAATQPVRDNAGEVLFETVRGAQELATGLRRAALGLEFLGRAVRRVEVDGHTLVVTMGHVGAPDVLPAAGRDLADRIERAGGAWTLRVLEEPLREVYAQVSAPALGYVTARPVPAAAPVRHPVEVTDDRLANGLLTVDVLPDGTLRLVAADGTVLDGVGRIVDESDVGDLYNFAPAVDGTPVQQPVAVGVSVEAPGPLVGALEVHRAYLWPAAPGQPAVEVAVTTRVELRAGERFCRLDVRFDNRGVDHRVRLHVPLPTPATHSAAEGQFAVVRRGLTSEGGHGEEPIATFPAYGFVDAGSAAVLLDQVSEYELVDGGRELAITLLRATGLISRAEHPWRAEPAGPVIATPRAQCLGEVRTRLAVLPHAGDWARADVVGAAEEFRCEPPTAPGTRLIPPGAEPPAPSGAAGLHVDGAVLSSLRRRGDRLELRVVALGDGDTTATVSLPRLSRAYRADLRGRPGGELPVVDGRLTWPLRAWEIATVQLVTGPPAG